MIYSIRAHESHINTITFDDAGRLYSGDGVGVIKVWAADLSSNGRYECIRVIDTQAVNEW